MSDASAAAERRWPDWLQSRLRWMFFPAWGLSLVAHWGIFLALVSLTQWKSCQPDVKGDGGEGLREVGIHIKDSAQPGAEPEPPREGKEDGPEETSIAELGGEDLLKEPRDVFREPALSIEMPELKKPALLGMGGPPRTGMSGVSEAVLGGGRARSGVRGVPGGRGAGKNAGGGTQLFGIADEGRKFLYVMDVSGSMAQYDAIFAAKNELMASLRKLGPTQQFQVILFNETFYAPRPRGNDEMFWGTEPDRQDVELWLTQQGAELGTRPVPALLKAMKYRPDVIFFLSDGALEDLTNSELEAIVRENSGNARVHCIEFGRGSNPNEGGKPTTPMQRLAAGNSGKYTYIDVTQFRVGER